MLGRYWHPTAMRTVLQQSLYLIYDKQSHGLETGVQIKGKYEISCYVSDSGFSL